MRDTPISQYSSQPIGILVDEEGVPTDADAPGVHISIRRKSDNVVVVPSTLATNDPDGVGLYSYTIGTVVTAQKDDYVATWTYAVGGTNRVFADEFFVTDPQPFWDALTPAEKQIVLNVYFRISDLWDSTLNRGGGGPYLWEVPQSKFGYETIARLMATDALTYINFRPPVAFVPPFTVGTGSAKPFPEGWHGLLEKATEVSVYKHLSRSYLEQPDVVGVPTARLDRAKYHTLWKQEAEQEQKTLDSEVGMLKRKWQTGINTRAMLLAGGLFPTATSYLSPERPRWPYVTVRWQ